MSSSKRKASLESRGDSKRLRVEPVRTPAFNIINSLNDDCLAAIFTYLSIEDRLKVRAVCQRWRDMKTLVWSDMKTLEISNIPSHLRNDGVMEIIFKESGNYLNQLKLGKMEPRAILPLIVEHCANLKHLEIVLASTDMTSHEWLAQIKGLESLRLKGHYQHFSRQFFDTLSSENLTQLHLASSYLPIGLKPEMIPSIFSRLTKLVKFSVVNFSLGVDVLTAIFAIANLTSLGLVTCSIEGPFSSKNLTSLERLTLGGMNEITNDFLSQIPEMCNNLKYLNLTHCISITDAGITELQKLCQLEALYLDGVGCVTDEPLSRMHNLKQLSCSGCERVHDNGIITLIKYAPNLTFLDLQLSGVTERVLSEAAWTVRERSNGLKLEIFVQDPVKSRWKQDDVPPLLVVESKSSNPLHVLQCVINRLVAWLALEIL